MAVDKQLLEQCIVEASEGDKEFADAMRAKLGANDALAAKFVAGFMRNADYTRKTQELADQRKQFEGQTGQLDALRKALEAAETEKTNILKELAGHRIGTAKARELMKLLQEKYQLTDEDLPGMSDLIETSKKGKPVDTTEDVDSRIKAAVAEAETRMEKKFAGAMIPEIGAMAVMPRVWGAIEREHRELTGKDLSDDEAAAILRDARDNNKSLKQAWEDKFSIGGNDGLRMKKRDERLKSDWEKEREAAEADKRSKAALEVVTPTQADLGSGPGISPAFKTKFRTFEMDPNKPAAPVGDGVPTLKVEPGQHVRQAGDRGPTGAQRAAARYIKETQEGKWGTRKAS